MSIWSFLAVKPRQRMCGNWKTSLSSRRAGAPCGSSPVGEKDLRVWGSGHPTPRCRGGASWGEGPRAPWGPGQFILTQAAAASAKLGIEAPRGLGEMPGSSLAPPSSSPLWSIKFSEPSLDSGPPSAPLSLCELSDLTVFLGLSY